MKDLAEKTDIGRLAAPSAMRLIYDSARPNGKTSEGRLSSELWNDIEQLIQVNFPDLVLLCSNLVDMCSTS